MAKKKKVKKPFYKKWWVWLIAIVIIGSIATSGEETATTDKAEPTSAKASEDGETNAEPKEEKEEKEEPKKGEKKTTGIGEPLKVGDVVFTANGTSTATNVGGEYGQTAQGVYYIVDVTVKNEGKEAITTDSSFFTLKSGDTTYDANATADIYINEAGGGFFFQSINPGIENKGKIVFDIPKEIAESNDLVLGVQTGMFGTETGEISLSKQ